jgi:hypothetical protein
MGEPTEPVFSYLNQLLRPNVLVSPGLLGAFYPVPKRSVFVSYHHGLDRQLVSLPDHFLSKKIEEEIQAELEQNRKDAERFRPNYARRPGM